VNFSEILQDAHVWIGIALVMVALVFWRIKVPGMVTKALDDAAAKVQAQLDEAARLRAEAAAMLAQVKAQRADTEKAAAEMLKTAQADADRLRAEAAVKLDEDIKRRGDLALRRIAVAEAQAAGDVKAAAADLAAQTAETVLAARLAGAKGDPLIDAGLAGLATRFAA